MTRLRTNGLLAILFLILATTATVYCGFNGETQSVKNDTYICVVTGTVFGGSGDPAKGATVIATDEHGKEKVARTDSKGRFRLDGIIPGALYHIEIRHPGYKYQVTVRSFLEGDHIEIRPSAKS